MKNKKILILIKSAITAAFVSIIAVSFTTENNNGSISLPDKWKFHTGDNPDFSKPDFNDSAWGEIPVGAEWEANGYANYDGIGWYRTKIIIPSALKKSDAILNALKISLGKIDDFDSTYFNGKFIGAMGGWQTVRDYLIAYDLVNWDKENTIAVRVNDEGGNGGFRFGPFYLSNQVSLSDVAVISAAAAPSENAGHLDKLPAHQTMIFSFKVPVDKVEGAINVKIFNPANNDIVYKKEEPITVGSKADTACQVAVDIKEPGAYLMNVFFTSKYFIDTLKYNTLYKYNTITHAGEKTVSQVVNLTVPGKAVSFALDDIKLGGYLDERLNANLTERLLKIDETGILECYYSRPGKQTWVGEYPGKYLHAAARVWQYSKNAALKTKMGRIVDILIASQNADGYLGTYMPKDYWTDWDVWAHKYNILGLLSYYSVTGYQPALDACKKMGDLLCRTFGEEKGQKNIVESSGHVGMASTSVLEPMTYLYRYTGDKKYLDFCKYIIKAYDSPNGPKIITTLTTIGKVDKTANGKAYEMTSNLTGIVKLYQLTGDKTLLKAADNAWKDIAAYKLYITGTASEHEFYREDFHLPAENNNSMGEGCVTTTWLQFCQALYNLTGEAKYMDEMEKTIYNHLFAAENPQTGCVSYYTALQGKKPFRCTIDAHCCLASIPRGIAAIPELAFTKNADNGFNINLYSPGKFTEKIKSKDGKEVVVEFLLQTEFPANGIINIKVNPATKTAFRLDLRVPVWCNNFKATVNGKILKGIPGTYLNMDETWNKNSIIKVSFDLKTQVLDGGISYPNSIAFKTGVQVLSIDQTLNPQIKNLDEIKIGKAAVATASKILLPKGWVGSQVFKTKASYKGKTIDLILVPFADAGQTGGEVRVWIKKS
jgi:DUF1680 family protein